MNARLEVMVAREDGNFVVLERSLDLSMSPFVGLWIGLSPDLAQRDPRIRRYEQLMHQVSDNTTHFEVDRVTFYPQGRADAHAVLHAKEVVEPTDAKANAYIELLTTFYGFQRSTDAT
jgi:hypothetical protein